MRRREFIALFGGATVVGMHPVRAQQPKVHRIGLLDYSGPEPGGARLWHAFRQKLRELGYVEGQNVAFESRWADSRIDRLPALAAELVDAKIDLMVTASSPAAVAAQHATADIPIVMATGATPWGSEPSPLLPDREAM